MKKKSSLWKIMVIATACILLTNSWTTANSHVDNVFVDIKPKSDLPDSVIIDYIHDKYMEIDSLSSVLSRISKKKKIETTGWDIKYRNNGLKYRLAILYGFKLEDLNTDGETRLDFFIAAVHCCDYEILDLLNFKDPALDMNSCMGETVLTAAVRDNNLKMVKYLLKRGVDKNKREFPACYDDAEEEQNAYEMAESLGYKDIMKALK